VELYGVTRGSLFEQERPRGPLLIQGDHGPVAYRNVWVAPAGRPDMFLLGTTPQRMGMTTPRYVSMLKELGYDGTWHSGYEDLGEMVKELDRQGLRMYTVYTPVNLDGDKAPYDPKLKEAIEILKDREAILWLHVHSSKLKPSDPAGDVRAVEFIRQIAALAGPKGVQVALYPHQGFWIERVEDSERVARKVNRENVGAAFNQCHWMMVDGRNLTERLEKARGHLLVASINGADRGKTWKELIQPLDRGVFEVYPLIKMLKQGGYEGSVGLQTYGITDAPADHLKRSSEVWRQFTRRLHFELD